MSLTMMTMEDLEEGADIGADSICFAIDPRLDVEGETERVAALCKMLLAQKKNKCVWISFLGYDDDPREVWDIEECQLWARYFFAAFWKTKGDVYGWRALSVLADEGEYDQDKKPGFGLISMLILAGMGMMRETDRVDAKTYYLLLTPLGHSLVESLHGKSNRFQFWDPSLSPEWTAKVEKEIEEWKRSGMGKRPSTK